MDFRTMVSNDVYLLPLKDDGSPDISGGYIFLSPKSNAPIIVRFAIEGTSSICRHGSLWVNIPEEGQEFQRNKYREFKLEPDFNRTIQISIPIYESGAFAFYTTYTPLHKLSETAQKPLEPARTETYYIDVAPRLVLDGEYLPMPALCIFSTISKFMGKYPYDWEKHLVSISERGYNMIHFTPLQRRGASNSPYSIFNQLEWDPTMFPNGEADVKDLINSMQSKYGLLGLTDVVWNHTAHNSEWVQEHPEVGYNLSTAPWLRAALELDDKLLDFSSKLSSYNLPTTLTSIEDLTKIMEALKERVIDDLKLWEYYVIDVQRDASAAIDSWKDGQALSGNACDSSICATQLEEIAAATITKQASFLAEEALFNKDTLGKRFVRRIDPGVAAALIREIFGEFEANNSDTADQEAARSLIIDILNAINLPLYKEYDRDVEEILTQLHNRIKYVRLDDHGPKLGVIDAENPLIETYFTRLPKNSVTSKHSQEDLALVNNGWVWAANALVDNAGPKSRAYLRREVIVWGDCIKLRYGDGPQDCPYLWDHMSKYTRIMAKYFTGFRIDNCHSTPIHVAEFFLDEARRVRPDLFVVAELFTGSEEMDYVFVKRLGISSLIREAMQAWSTGELSRLVHRHGGRPIGSFEVDEISEDIKNVLPENGADNSNPQREIIRRIRRTPVHALFMDCTHDNEVPAQKRDARDTLPNAALVNMCSSATGSVMGYDEVYPKLVDLVNETRLYSPPSGDIASQSGIGNTKKLLNQIHNLMGKDGYDETHIHHEDQYITVHRVHPKSRKGYFLIAHTAFPGYGNGNGGFNPVHLTGTKARHLGSWMLKVDTSEEAKKAILNDKELLRGLPSKVVDVIGIRMETKSDETIITVRDKFPPGSIALFETWIPEADHAAGLDNYVTSGGKAAFSEVDLIDLNFVLYRCEAEELDSSDGKDGVYDIPGYGKLVYAGLQGWWSLLKNIIRENDLAHPLCQHLRDGKWALDYIHDRLEKAANTAEFSRLTKPSKWLSERFDAIRRLPSFLLPRYFGLVIQTAYHAAWDRGLELMSQDVRNGQWFLQSLSMVSLQQTGFVRSGSIHPKKLVPSLAAGLPHFAVEWARCWGRDVFISATGLFIGTGRFKECKEHIIAFASVLKHGLVPNLLSSCRNPRYNARDAIWFMLQCIQEYTVAVPSGLEILKESIPRRFLPYDDTYFDVDDPRAYSQTSTLEDIIQEALQRHASGIKFREANAGPQLDCQMRSNGFNQSIFVDWSNGLIFGGNQDNCGTWMDKMGESEKAGSKGVPGTPRDGAAVEINGLLFSSLTWLAKLHKQGSYKYAGVSTNSPSHEFIQFCDWANLIKTNFKRCYYIPRLPSEDIDYEVNSQMVNRRGIYKDLYRSGKEYEDYQLRPNFPIAMTVAPDLFEPAQALHALKIVDNVLRGKTGLATLDPSDLNYRPYYNNGEDSEDFATSKGRNYHQGPEWIWPTGYFLRALLKFDLIRRENDNEGSAGKIEAFQQITRRLKGCKEAMIESPWAGLTELTQKDGAYCRDSSPTQAWSAGCLIDLYRDASAYDVRQLREDQ
ncbi:Bgt-4880 [Blumeria graminis f. sp. tritici]|uniref:Glycogen debranching enzyme n=2 Tax=Blumeria graminis f. sp. tritici TaxID=62690 RepID=A0A061HK78_BLUGR|nr:Glycogen debranching enzyme [Blumeria graminis f. sp. tritici 96224]VDB92920.1 Bgt-4880 [Blumeria graminis f. sp. tritici]